VEAVPVDVWEEGTCPQADHESSRVVNAHVLRGLFPVLSHAQALPIAHPRYPTPSRAPSSLHRLAVPPQTLVQYNRGVLGEGLLVLSLPSEILCTAQVLREGQRGPTYTISGPLDLRDVQRYLAE